MQRLTIPAAVCATLERLEPITRQIVLGHIYDLRVLELAPDVSCESETIRLLWPDIVKEYEKNDKASSRMRTVREQFAQEVPLPLKEKASPHTPYKEKHTSFPQELLDQTLFDRWWAVYPRRVGKKAARVKFFAILRKSSDPQKLVEAMISSVQEQERKLEWSKDRIQYVPHPLTWLNQGRWEDEVIELGPEKRPARDPRKADNWIGTPPDRIEDVF